MNEVILSPKNKVAGQVLLPSSKSYAQRAIALAGLSQTEVTIRRLVESDDCIAAQNIIRELGAQFVRKGDDLLLNKGIDLITSQYLSIHCGESGLSTRLFSAFSLLYNQPFTIHGEGSITERTMEMVIEGLTEFGKKVESNENKLTLIISGKSHQCEVTIDGSISSQFLTGLLTVAPFLKSDTVIHVKDLKSKPYIAMTLDLLAYFGLEWSNENYEKFIVEGDWSAASFYVVARAIGGKLRLKGLAKETRQGDVAILNAVQQAGANIKWDNDDLIVEKDTLNPIQFDATECPDLFPPLVVLAAHAKGTSVIEGVQRLKHKESDRALTLQKECAKVGIQIEIQEDKMIVHGRGRVEVDKKVVFSSHNDHRIAMAMSLFSIGAKVEIKISDAMAVNKSYPDFYKDFLTL